ncbi:helix-turn-helix domain-containing protein, partial [Streptomyces sp. NPDC088789]|uniref:helix-turn-helix domain-containing protein n=1 Tax=Streptomyces sp. NPDC088789 TaxID=3365899 RepID=UPI0038190872
NKNISVLGRPATRTDTPSPPDRAGHYERAAPNFDRWRTHLRLRAALPLLAEGQPVSRVAHTVGYATSSAFLAAFRRTVGTSPGRYLSGDASFEASATSAADE